MKNIYKTSDDATKLAALNYLAKSLNLTPNDRHGLSGQPGEFMDACLNDNSVGELVEALESRRADTADSADWKITPTEWRMAIRAALETKIFNAIQDIENA